MRRLAGWWEAQGSSAPRGALAGGGFGVVGSKEGWGGDRGSGWSGGRGLAGWAEAILIFGWPDRIGDHGHMITNWERKCSNFKHFCSETVIMTRQPRTDKIHPRLSRAPVPSLA